MRLSGLRSSPFRRLSRYPNRKPSKSWLKLNMFEAPKMQNARPLQYQPSISYVPCATLVFDALLLQYDIYILQIYTSMTNLPLWAHVCMSICQSRLMAIAALINEFHENIGIRVYSTEIYGWMGANQSNIHSVQDSHVLGLVQKDVNTLYHDLNIHNIIYIIPGSLRPYLVSPFGKANV